MAFYWVLVLAICGIAFGEESCPDAEQFKPCTCDAEGINCNYAKSLEEIQKSFSIPFKYDVARAIYIQGTPLTSLPADLFGKQKVISISIEVNQITKVDPEVFRASKKMVTMISLYGNKLTEIPFKDLSEYKKLGTLNLGQNELESLPANAFKSRTLWSIILAENKISHIEPDAFEGLPNLGRLEMSMNKLKTIGPRAFAMTKTSPLLQINLASNGLTDIDTTAFEGLNPTSVYLTQNELTSLKKDIFEDLVISIAQNGKGFLEVSMNKFTCSGCDYKWIAINKAMLGSKLVGFKCEDGRSINDLTKENINCS